MDQESATILREGAFPYWSREFQAAIERLRIAERRPAEGFHQGDAPSRQRGRASAFADFRPYVPGDDPRLIDWRAYARLDRLYLKQFDEERARTVTILVDLSASMDFGEDGESRSTAQPDLAHKGLFARRLAAALLWIAQCRGDRARLYVLRGGQAQGLGTISSRDGLGRAFQALAAVHEAGQTGLADALRGVTRERRSGPTLLLSDLLDADWDAALTWLGATGEGALIQVLSPPEWEPRLGTEVELEDAETGVTLPTRLGPAELAAYRARREAFQSGVREVCRRREIRAAFLNTAVPLARIVLHELPAAGILT